MSEPPRSSRRLSLLHIIAGLEDRYGGPSYSVPRLCAELARGSAQVTLATVADRGVATTDCDGSIYREIRCKWTGSRLPVVSPLRLSLGLRRTLWNVAPAVDVVHNHGLWLAPNVLAADAARRAGKPFVLSPRGMLAPEALRFSRRRKAVFWRFVLQDAFRDIACVHATSHQEADEVRAFGLAAPIAVIPNGVDLPDLAPQRPSTPDGKREALYLGRLHPKKGLDVLVEAWARLAPGFRGDWRLRIVGPAEDGYDERLAALVAARGMAEVSIEGPIYGPARFDAHRRADLFILPTRNENFGLTVAEALASETPVICSRGAPWSGLEQERCGWWPDFGVDAIERALHAALSTPAPHLRTMGRNGRAWMERDFSWRAVAARLRETYRWLRDGGEPPEVVLAD